MPQTNRLTKVLAAVIVIAIVFAGGYLLGTFSRSGTITVPVLNPASPEAERRQAIGEVWDIIFADYVDRSKLQSANLSRAAIEGMLKVLDDPYTSYLDEEEFALGKSALEGSYEGIGAYVSMKDGRLTIIAPIPDSPAAKAGIRAGDIILEIDGRPVTGMSLAEAIIRIRGPSGSAVRLLVLHEGDETPVELEIIRAAFELPSVHFEMKDGIAYIKITDFTERTPQEMATVVKKMQDAGAQGIILDLRGNPGGLLEPVIDIASYFITEGVILQIRNNQGEISVMEAKKDLPKVRLPMVVLVDGASASGSEVLAGSLQDHGRATIAGSTTYGKGSVNMLYQLRDGSGLYLTTARWLTPNGRLIESYGITPDITLEAGDEDAILWAMEYLRSGKGGK